MRTLTSVLLVLLVTVVPVWYIADLTQTSTVSEMNKMSHERLMLYESTLKSAFKEYSYLPFVLSENERIRSAVSGKGDLSAMSRFLESVNAKAGSAALFVLDEKGTAIASSNWKEEHSFVGHNYSFRPYFTDAMKGQSGAFFAVGVTTAQPGYFMSHPIRQGTKIIGVAAVKIDLSPLQHHWRDGGETVFVTDANGIFFLSSKESWLYRTLYPLDRQTLNKITARQQYSGIELHPLGLNRRVKAGVDEVTIEGRDFLMMTLHISGLEWDMHYLMPMSMVSERTRNAVMISSAAAILIIMLGLFLRERHLKNISRIKAIDAERILEINQQLAEEIEERSRKEKELREIQEELIQAGKLAVLGQMSAIIVHELNQPISAVRTYVASTKLMLKLGESEKIPMNLDNISELVERMASVTGQLKAYARKSPERLEDVDLRQSLQNALSILQYQITADDCQVQKDIPQYPIIVAGDSIRLTQVFVNIIRNAIDAVLTVERKRISIVVRQVDQSAEVIITDSGTGLNPEIRECIFEPFVTTKDVGEGMGLGLSISCDIIRKHYGEIMCENMEGGGASFTVRLPLKEHDKPA